MTTQELFVRCDFDYKVKYNRFTASQQNIYLSNKKKQKKPKKTPRKQNKKKKQKQKNPETNKVRKWNNTHTSVP